jgi:bifunctional non-homologous end joining protein LigD
MPEATIVEVEGRELTLTNLDKVIYPKSGTTKASVIDYYARVAPVLLPHLEGRAITMKRYPDGVEGSYFYEKQVPTHAPEWITTVPVATSSKTIDYVVIDSLASLVWAANLANLELHTFLARARTSLEPTMLAFDLDPGEPADVLDCCDVALWLRDALDALSLRSFPKTSGSKGMQLYVPLNVAGATFDETKAFARALGQIIEQEHPKRVTTRMMKVERPGKVFIDWSQNDAHKTTVSVYSLRARDRPYASTPLGWEEVERAAGARDAALLRFRADEVLARVERHGDLFAPVLELRQTLPIAG